MMTLRDALERAAKVCEKRAERRFEEHGYTEPDTNAGYYVGEYAELGDSLDEEDADCAAAIRALIPADAAIECQCRDAQRYRWLRHQASFGAYPFGEVRTYRWKLPHIPDHSQNCDAQTVNDFDAFDAAIDAAKEKP